jgi:hypothetical protein
MVKKFAVVLRAGWTVRCGVEGEDGDASSDAVIAEAKPRTLRKRQLCLVHGGRGRAIAARDDALLLLFPASSIYSLTRIAYSPVCSIATRYHVFCACHLIFHLPHPAARSLSLYTRPSIDAAS